MDTGSTSSTNSIQNTATDPVMDYILMKGNSSAGWGGSSCTKTEAEETTPSSSAPDDGGRADGTAVLADNTKTGDITELNSLRIALRYNGNGSSARVLLYQ